MTASSGSERGFFTPYVWPPKYPYRVPSGDCSVSTRTTRVLGSTLHRATWRRKLLDEISSAPGKDFSPGSHPPSCMCSAQGSTSRRHGSNQARHRQPRYRLGVKAHYTGGLRTGCVSRGIGRDHEAGIGCSQVEEGLIRDCALRYMPLHPPYYRETSRETQTSLNSHTN